ncbi:MAG: thermonuclease family protein [Patescibacteria group bacterium]|nr:thermonuclease family protein [Patescibacteria group bacterium]
MISHHKHGIKQTLGAFLVVLIGSAALFLVIRPNLYSVASEKKTYVPPEGILLSLPDTDKIDTSEKITTEPNAKSRDIYIAQPQGLPLFKVTEVVDGNTIILEGISRIRLIGIKAPDQDEEFGIEATDFLKALVDQKEVYFQIDEKNPQDELGRLRGIIYIDKKNVNIEILRAGFAHIFPTTPSIVGYDDWAYFENEAREAKRGLWSGEKPKLKDILKPSF